MLHFYKTVFVCLLSILLLSACNRSSSQLELALKSAASNRAELEKVLLHYSSPQDSLKRKAAEFLIQNMPGKYTLKGELLDKYLAAYPLTEKGHLFEDSLSEVLGPLTAENCTADFDLKTITSDFLIQHIDASFHQWQSAPWRNEVSFANFCEYVLPYRSRVETLELWRKPVREMFAAVIDSIEKTHPSALDACRAMVIEMKKRDWTDDEPPIYPKPTILVKAKNGSCFNQADYVSFVCRSAGLPVGEDYIPQFASANTRHVVNFVMDMHGKAQRFDPPDMRPGDSVTFTETCGKIYRRTFSIQPHALVLKDMKLEDIPLIMQDPCLLDVTSEYFRTSTVSVQLATPAFDTQYAYLATFNNSEWVPVCAAKRTKTNKAIFPKMGNNIVYLPVFYKAHQVHPAGSPFLLTKDGKIRFFKTDTKRKIDVTLNRKFRYSLRTKRNFGRMTHGQFQVANKADFSNARTIYTIAEAPVNVHNEVKITVNAPYRYVRYVSSLDTSYCNVAELEFYNAEGKKLSGKVMGMSEKGLKDKKKLTNVFDGDVLTYFDSAPSVSGWVGLDLGKKEKISKLVFSPRNDGNYVMKGELYELFYFQNRQFVSLGSQTAKDYKLDYKNVPANGLYLLRDRTKGVEERIFSYENGKQVWW